MNQPSDKKRVKRSFYKKLFIKLRWKNFLELRYFPSLFRISASLIFCCTAYPFILRIFIDYDYVGIFGDQYGAINALISGLAFAAFWASLQLQRHELRLQRQELSRANREAKDQTKQFQNQVILARESQAQDEIYRRLTLLKQQEADIIIRWKEKIDPFSPKEEWRQASGMEATSKYYKNNIDVLQRIHSGLTLSISNFIMSKNTHCEALFVWIYSFFALVDDIKNIHQESPKEKNRYIKLVLNCLSSHEKGLIFLLYKTLHDEHINQLFQQLNEKYTDFSLFIPSSFHHANILNTFESIIEKKAHDCTILEMKSHLECLIKTNSSQ